MVINLIDILSIWKKSGEMVIDKLIRENSLWMGHPLDDKIIQELNSYINVSEKHKIILWLWKKCGTSHMTKIMNKFDFRYYKIVDNKLIPQTDKIVQKHYCNLFNGHEKYKIVSAVRNPYSRFFSDYTFNRPKDDFILNDTNIENFRKFIYETTIYSNYFSETLSYNCLDLKHRIPDYPVRLENLYEDYSKIPFIVNSEYYKSGELLNDISLKVNVSNEDENLWRKFYTQEIADIIYYRMPRYFEIFGYEKNSWKQ
jgi:hypothetical protein